jgi:phage gp29-like protein
MPKRKKGIDVNEYLARMGYGGVFSNPFSLDYGRDPKNMYASAWDAFDKMLAWDPEIAALDKNARLAVLAHDTEIVPATDDAESEKAADFCIEVVSNIKNWEDIRYDLLDSPAKGFAPPIQKNYVRDGGYYTIADTDVPALQALPQHWFYWKMVDGRMRLVFQGSYGDKTDVPIDEELFIIARHGYTVENPYGRGYLTEAFWTFVKKKILQGYMIRLCERGVEVERWAQCVTGDQAGEQAWKDKDNIRNALSDFGRYSDAVFPPGVTVEHQTGDSGALQSEINFIQLLDGYLAKVVLGQTLTTEQSRYGTYNMAVVQDLQRARKVVSWCKDQMADINDQFITPLCELNFNVGRAKWRIKYEPEDDRKDQAERIAKLAEKYDVELPAEWLHHAQGFPEPQEEGKIYIPRGGGGGFGGEEGGEFPAFAQKKNIILASKQEIADKRVKLIDREVKRQIELSKKPVERRLREWKQVINKSRSYDDLTARIESRDTNWPEFADTLRSGVVAAYALGMATQAEQTKVLAAANYDTWEDVLKAFRDKVPISAEAFYNLDQELRAKYFATAIAEDVYMAETLQGLMAKAIEGGETFSTFKIGAYDAMKAAGYKFPEPWRLYTVFHRHIRTADDAGREDWYEIPEVNETIWGFEYLTSGRPNVRPSHAKLNHTKLPKDHPFWLTNSPQLDYG